MSDYLRKHNRDTLGVRNVYETLPLPIWRGGRCRKSVQGDVTLHRISLILMRTGTLWQTNAEDMRSTDGLIQAFPENREPTTRRSHDLTRLPFQLVKTAPVNNEETNNLKPV